MRSVGFSEAQQIFADLVDDVTSGGVPVEIVRQGKRPVVLVDAKEYASMAETLHLLSTRANAERLFAAIDDVEAGRNLVYHDLIERD